MTFKVFGLFNLPEDRVFTFNIYYLTFSGLWQYDHWSEKQLLLYKIYQALGHVFTIFFLIISGIGNYQCKNDISKLLSNLHKSFIAYRFVLKLLVFIMHRKLLKTLINDIEHSEDEVTQERKKWMCYNTALITALGMSVMGLFLGLTVLKKEIVMVVWTPFDFSNDMTNLLGGDFVIAVTFVVSMIREYALQGIVCSLIMYVCHQLVEVQERLRNLNYDHENDITMREEFKKIIAKHVRLMRYSKSITMMFSQYLLIQNVAIVVEFGLNVMVIAVVGQTTLSTSFIVCLFVSLIHHYIYCSLGNALIDKLTVILGNKMITDDHNMSVSLPGPFTVLYSRSVAQYNNSSVGIAKVAYETKWTSWPIDLQKDILIVIQASQKPLTLSAGGIADMSLETFSQTVYKGYSVFAVLNDII